MRLPLYQRTRVLSRHEVCSFSDADTLEGAMVQWSSTLKHLKPDIELALRGYECKLGGPISDHFMEVADSPWHVWPLSAQQHSELQAGAPLTLDCKVSFARAVGVEPTVVQVVQQCTLKQIAQLCTSELIVHHCTLKQVVQHCTLKQQTLSSVHCRQAVQH